MRAAFMEQYIVTAVQADNGILYTAVLCPARCSRTVAIIDQLGLFLIVIFYCCSGDP